MSNNKNYPYISFSFAVEINGILSAGFSEISGLTIETEIEDILEGGLNTFVHKLPKRSKYGNVTLKKGITTSTDLYNWYMDIVKGKIKQENMRIIQYDNMQNQNSIRDWTFKKAFPVKWIGPDLNATSNNIAFESIEIAHSGLLGI